MFEERDIKNIFDNDDIGDGDDIVLVEDDIVNNICYYLVYSY